MRTVLFVSTLLLTACVQQQYWSKDGVGLQQTATDLAECRKGAGNEYVMVQQEQPCMIGKGYALGNKPPAQ